MTEPLPGYPAVFSPDRSYRYVLWRSFTANPERYVQFVALNPSTADEETDDPTLRRCVGFARDWGFDALCITNLFAWRATDPAHLKTVEDPVGPENDRWLRTCAEGARRIVVAWGEEGGRWERANEVLMNLPQVLCLGKTRQGYPRHPLYVSRSTEPVRYDPAVNL